MPGTCALALGLLVALAPRGAAAKPYHDGDFTPDAKLDALQAKVGAKHVPLEGADRLARTKAALHAAKAGEGTVRILHLSDSHVASDFITSKIRHGLQARFGDAGRGFAHADQPFGYGGRRIAKKDSDWEKDRIVDKGRAGRPYGFSGHSLESKKKGAKIRYHVAPEDRVVRIFLDERPGAGEVELRLDGEVLSRFSAAGDALGVVHEAAIPAPAKKGKRALELVALGKGVRVYGLSFESGGPGVLYDAIGPVGADAKVYLQLEPKSFERHLAAYRPTLVALMVGGNDAMKIRKKWTTAEKVEQDHVDLIRLLKASAPGVECLLFTPMDAGEQVGKKVVSKPGLDAILAMQKRVAAAEGCAVWDMHAAMGGEGSVGRWAAAKVMNKDLVHPYKPAADLLGRLFLGGVLPALE